MFQTLTDEPSFFTITCLQDNCLVASLDYRFVRQCMNIFPQVLLKKTGQEKCGYWFLSLRDKVSITIIDLPFQVLVNL